jgi:purine-nucleoside phosphorylase
MTTTPALDPELLAADALRPHLGASAPRVACLLGSGLGRAAHSLDPRTTIPFAEIPGFPRPTVTGHTGELVIGMLAGVPLLAFAGRFHLYEGHTPAVVALPVRVAHALGVRTLLTCNAAGGIRRSLRPGDFMLIRDHINLMWRNPLVGPVRPGETRFPDMSRPYDPELTAALRDAALEAGVPVADGVYAAVLGPSYETPAEIRMLERLGADAVGMSTVPEVIAARALGMRVAALSCITNLAAGLGATPLTHAEVIRVAGEVEGRLARLLQGFAVRLGTAGGPGTADAVRAPRSG